MVYKKNKHSRDKTKNKQTKKHTKASDKSKPSKKSINNIPIRHTIVRGTLQKLSRGTHIKESISMSPMNRDNIKMVLDKNEPIDILKTLDANIFSTVKKTSINCNILLLKNINRGISNYTIKTPTRIYKASDEEIAEIENILKIHGNKLCTYDVKSTYLDDVYKTSTFSFILLSSDYITYKLRKRHKQSLTLCGILFLNEKKNSRQKNDKKINLYLPLICSKPGLGGVLLNYAETLGTIYGYHKLLLKSIDKPFGFYLYKQYQLEKGTNTHEFDKAVQMVAFTKTPNNKLKVNNRLKNTARFRHHNGTLRKYNNLASILPPQITQNNVERHRFLKSGVINSLHGIKKDGDGVHLFKILNP